MYSAARPGSGPRQGSSSSPKKMTLSEQVEIKGLKRPMKISLPEGGPSGRTEYVEYALDMLVHNLIGSGQLDPSKADLVRTNEMRAHINHLADRVEAAQHAGYTTHISTKQPHIPPKGTKWALQPNSLPITIITNKDPRPRSKSKSVERKRTNILKVPMAAPKSRPVTPLQQQNKNNRPRSRSTSNQTYPTRARSKTKTVIDENLLPIAARYRSKSRGRRSGANSLVSLRREVADNIDDKEQVRPAISMGPQGFRAKLDMTGFTNDEIALDLKGRTLTVTGTRGKRDGLNTRKTTETIEIPLTVNVDQLKVARQVDGTLVIQETPIDRSLYMS